MAEELQRKLLSLKGSHYCISHYQNDIPFSKSCLMQDSILSLNICKNILFFVFFIFFKRCLIKNKAFTFRLVEKCTVENGGCHSSADCTNPTKPGDEVVCSCGDGKQLGSDGETCTSIADAEKYCPTSTCWTYETVEGTKKCVMKLRV